MEMIISGLLIVILILFVGMPVLSSAAVAMTNASSAKQLAAAA